MFRFFIRDLLWLTLVAALAIGWWTDRWRLWDETEHHRQTVEGFRKIGVNLDELLTHITNQPAQFKVIPVLGPNRNTPFNDYQSPPLKFKNPLDHEKNAF